MIRACIAVLAALVLAPATSAGVGTSFPPGFEVPTDASLGVPVLGFGAPGPVTRTPVIFLHGIVSCSPSPLNYWQLPALGGFTPDSAICREYGAADTPFLEALNRNETPGRTQFLVVRNSDASFVYFSKQDGLIAPVPAENREGEPHDFSLSAMLKGATNVDLTGQGRYDDLLGTAHIGILNSPETWRHAYEFLAAKKR